MGRKAKLRSDGIAEIEADKVQVTLHLDPELCRQVIPIISQRGLGLSEVVSLYLRTLVSGNKRTRPLELGDEMPIGKFRGERFETVVRAEPGYVAWLLGTSETFRIGPEAMALLQALLPPERQ